MTPAVLPAAGGRSPGPPGRRTSSYARRYLHDLARRADGEADTHERAACRVGPPELDPAQAVSRGDQQDLITFRLANFYACQDDEAVANLARRRGVKFNTHGNTQIDTLRFGLANRDRAERSSRRRPVRRRDAAPLREHLRRRSLPSRSSSLVERSRTGSTSPSSSIPRRASSSRSSGLRSGSRGTRGSICCRASSTCRFIKAVAAPTSSSRTGRQPGGAGAASASRRSSSATRSSRPKGSARTRCCRDSIRRSSPRSSTTTPPVRSRRGCLTARRPR